MKRSDVINKAGMKKNRAVLRDWAEEHDRCHVCGITYDQTFDPQYELWPQGLQVHHIIHGTAGRSDEPCNLLRVCKRCHDRIHEGRQRIGRGPWRCSLSLANVLWYKRKATPKEYSPKRLSQLWHRAVPRPQKPEGEE